MSRSQTKKITAIILSVAASIICVVLCVDVATRRNRNYPATTRGPTVSLLDLDSEPEHPDTLLFPYENEVLEVSDQLYQGFRMRRFVLSGLDTTSSWIIVCLYFFNSALKDVSVRAIIEKFTSSLKALKDRSDSIHGDIASTFSYLEALKCLEEARSKTLSRDEKGRLKVILKKCVQEIRSPVRTFFFFIYCEKTYMRAYPNGMSENQELHNKFLGLLKVGKLLSDFAYAASDTDEMMRAVGSYADDLPFLSIFNDALRMLENTCVYNEVIPQLVISEDILNTPNEDLKSFYLALKEELVRLFQAIYGDYNSKYWYKPNFVVSASNDAVFRQIEKRVKYFFTDARFLSTLYTGGNCFGDESEARFGITSSQYYRCKFSMDPVGFMCLTLFTREDALPFAIEGIRYSSLKGDVIEDKGHVVGENKKETSYSPNAFLVSDKMIQEFQTASLPALISKFIQKYSNTRFKKRFVVVMSNFFYDCKNGLHRSSIGHSTYGYTRNAHYYRNSGWYPYKTTKTGLRMKLKIHQGTETRNYILKQFMYDRSLGSSRDIVIIRGVETNGRLVYYEHDAGYIREVDPKCCLRNYGNYVLCGEYVQIP